MKFNIKTVNDIELSKKEHTNNWNEVDKKDINGVIKRRTREAEAPHKHFQNHR